MHGLLAVQVQPWYDINQRSVTLDRMRVCVESDVSLLILTGSVLSLGFCHRERLRALDLGTGGSFGVRSALDIGRKFISKVQAYPLCVVAHAGARSCFHIFPMH